MNFHGKCNISPEVRFLAQCVNHPDGCITMNKKPAHGNVCQIRVNGKLVTAKRFAFESVYQLKLDPEISLYNSCGNEACVNVDHMIVATPSYIKRRTDKKKADKLWKAFASSCWECGSIEPRTDEFLCKPCYQKAGAATLKDNGLVTTTTHGS